MPSSGPPLADRLRRDALTRHGVGAATVGAVVRRTRRSVDVALVELARTVSVAVFQTCFQGSAGLAPHPRALAPGREYVMLHGHPE